MSHYEGRKGGRVAALSDGANRQHREEHPPAAVGPSVVLRRNRLASRARLAGCAVPYRNEVAGRGIVRGAPRKSQSVATVHCEAEQSRGGPPFPPIVRADPGLMEPLAPVDPRSCAYHVAGRAPVSESDSVARFKFHALMLLAVIHGSLSLGCQGFAPEGVQVDGYPANSNRPSA